MKYKTTSKGRKTHKYMLEYFAGRSSEPRVLNVRLGEGETKEVLAWPRRLDSFPKRNSYMGCQVVSKRICPNCLKVVTCSYGYGTGWGVCGCGLQWDDYVYYRVQTRPPKASASVARWAEFVARFVSSSEWHKFAFEKQIRKVAKRINP